MPIADDWSFDYANKVISHIDGVLTIAAGAGTYPIVGDYIQGVVSGAIGKVIALTGTIGAGGTVTLTNVLGLFQDAEDLDILAHLDFDGVDNGGFKVGDTITDQTTGSLDVVFVEYNIDGVDGHGTCWGTSYAAFVNNEALDVAGGASSVAVADGTGTDEVSITADTSGTLAVPGTTNTNNCIVLHYDGGTIDIPEDAHIQSAVAGAEGYAQAIYGGTVTGSVRVVDSDTTGGAWTDDEALRILDVEHYDTLVAGKVFSAGDVIRGATSLFEARVLAVIVDSGTTGRLILGGATGTPFTDTEDIDVLQADDTYVTYANVETGQNSYEDVAVIKLDVVSVKDEQRADQGGIYAAGSLLIVRSHNAFYSLNMDNFDELGQLDDKPAIDGDVRDQLYTYLNDYVIPDLSFRFLEKGAAKDSGNNNLFINLQSAGVLADVGNHGFELSTTNPTPRPDLYLEQDSLVKRQDWIEGPVDILVKVKTKNDPAYIDPAVEALGQLINGGTVSLHVRPYRRTYDSAEITAPAGGQQAIFLANAADLNNTTAQYSASVSGGSGTWIVGEEGIVAATGERVVCMSAVDGGTGPFTWANKVAGNNLETADVVVGVVSGASSTINAVSNVVAGYSDDIRVMVVQRKFAEDTAPSGDFLLGEVVTQAGTGATGYFMEYDAGSGDFYIEEQSGTFNGTGELTGGTTSETYTPTSGAVWGSVSSSEYVPKDIGGGVGDKNYLAVVTADLTGSSAETVQKIYEWWKFVLAKESIYQVNTPGGLFSAYTEGRIYRRLDTTFAETRGASAFGLKAGTLVIGAQGVYIERLSLATADVRSIQLVSAEGVTYDPPNVQTLETINLTAGVAAAAYRSDGVGSLDILRNEFDVGVVGSGNNQAADTTILIGANNRSVSPTPNDVPDSGVLRILDPSGSGNYLRFPYSSVDRVTNIFTLASGDIQDVTGSGVDLVLDDNVHVVFYEEVSGGASVSNLLQYSGDVNIYAVARIKGKKPFETTGTFGIGGLSIGANLNPDNVVNLP